MPFFSDDSSRFLALRSAPAALVTLLIAACSSTTSETPSDAGTSSDASTIHDANTNGDSSTTSDAGEDAAAATCSAPGAATPGPADTHCAGEDGGAATVQPTNAASCNPGPGADDGSVDDSCPYGDTLFGQEADDDDCKYHLKWSSTPICESAGGVTFTVVVTNKTDNSPTTGAGTRTEVFTTSPGDGGCDNQTTHPGPNSGLKLTEGPPGTYTGLVVFDAPGAWTVRFHIHEECSDLLPTSPHAHAAFHVTVP